MQNQFKILLASLLVLCLSACSFMDTRPQATLYDLGPLPKKQEVYLKDNATIKTAVDSQQWMEINQMVYRLNYQNNQQVRFYTQSSWTATPSELFKNRLDTFLIASRNVTYEEKGVPHLKLYVYIDDFSQHFESASDSKARILLRARLFKDGILVAQHSFAKIVPAETPDAAGGAKALAQASDKIIFDLIQWVSQY